MSTSFYVKLNEKKRNSLIQNINSNLIKDIFEDNEKIIDLLEENKKFGIKLGKISCGWQFIWHHHNGILFDINLNSIKNFLKEDIDYIIDEYGTKYTDYEFLDRIEESLYKNIDHIDVETYYKMHPNEPIFICKQDEDVININGSIYQAHLGEFKSDDKLRFFISNNYG